MKLPKFSEQNNWAFLQPKTLFPLSQNSQSTMRPFFPPGSNHSQPNGGGPQGSMMIPQFPLNQAPPQFQRPQPMANFSNPNNFAMDMSMLNQNPQFGMQLGFNQAFQNLNALAAMQFLGQATQMQQGPMQNLNFLGAGQLLANNLAQGLNQMVNNPIFAPFASGYGASNQGLTQSGNMTQINHANGSTIGTSNTVQLQNPINNRNNISQPRFQNNQFNPANNQNQFSGTRGRGRGRGMQFVRTGARGKGNWREGKMDSTVFSEKSKKRLPLIIYDPKEIKEWREARKRNFPTNTNVEKKLAWRGKEAKTENDDMELRCQQMKQVLEKQEELGFEAAEVPTHYLIGSKNKTHYDLNKNTQYSNRNSNRFNNKRGRFGARGRSFNFDKNSRNAPRNNNNNNNNRRGFDSNISEPSLLKKLLSMEIKADKRRILHAFRFMVLNSFFEESGDRELVFPEVRINGEENLEDLEENELSDERESGDEDERENVREEDEKAEEGEITD